MGTDIAAFIEVKRTDGAWECIYKPQPNEYYNPEHPDEEPEFTLEGESIDRNYWLFQLLAGVRSEDDGCIKVIPGCGGGIAASLILGYFTGWVWMLVLPLVVSVIFAIKAIIHEPKLGFRPFVEPRGMPDDLSVEISTYYGWGESAAFSQSWLTLAELEGFRWEETNAVTKQYIPPDEIPKTERGELPNSMAAWASRDTGYKQVEFTINAEKVAYDSIYPTIEKMRELTTNRSAEDVRLVFWFLN